MKAIRIHAYGGPEVLTYEDAPLPATGDDEVLVKVYAASVNPVDRYIRAGYFHDIFHYQFPFVPGVDYSGVIEATGSQVEGFAAGDEVYCFSGAAQLGAYAEHAAVNTAGIAHKPATIDHIRAAAVPLAGLTAWQALESAALQPGDTVLIHGAGGGVGTFAVQFALLRELRVLASASPDKLELLRHLGVPEIIDYTSIRFEKVASDVDAVVALVGGETLQRSWSVVRPGGTLVSAAEQLDPAAAQRKDIRAVSQFTQANAAHLAAIARLIDAGEVQVVVSDVYPLAEAQRAHEQLEGRHALGKVVLRVATEE